VTKKIRKAEAVPRVTEGNGILAFTEFVLFPAATLSGRREFRIERDRDGLEPLVYTGISQMHEDYKNDIVCSTNYLKYNFGFSMLTSFLVDTSIIETCCGEGSDWAYGTNPGGLPRFERMEGDSFESIPAG
jgi:hypothetical protein